MSRFPFSLWILLVLAFLKLTIIRLHYLLTKHNSISGTLLPLWSYLKIMVVFKKKVNANFLAFSNFHNFWVFGRSECHNPCSFKRESILLFADLHWSSFSMWTGYIYKFDGKVWRLYVMKYNCFFLKKTAENIRFRPLFLLDRFQRSILCRLVHMHSIYLLVYLFINLFLFIYLFLLSYWLHAISHSKLTGKGISVSMISSRISYLLQRGAQNHSPLSV